MDNLNFKVVKILNDVLETNWELPFKYGGNASSMGTGAFIDKKGYILTCAHVVCNSVSINVVVPGEGEKPYSVKLVGFCPALDIGLLKIVNYKPKHYFEIGDSNILKLGDEITTIGFPGTGDDNDNLKITKGIISGQQYGKIQIDAPISPGNSGGPMIFEDKIVGINVSSMVSFHIQNMNFSVPINNFLEINNDLLKLDKFKILYRPSLTLDYNTTNQLMRRKSKVDSGVYINNIYPYSMFLRSGIKEGDILLKINNYKIDNYGFLEKEWFNEKIDLKIYFNNKKNNEKVSIEYWSKSKNKKIISNLYAAPYKYPIRKMYPVYEKIYYEVIGGMIITDLNINYVIENRSDFKKYFENENRICPKIVICNIFKNSYIGRLNVFRKKEIISKIDDQEVNTILELKKVLKKNKKQYIKIESENKKVLIISKKDILENDKKLAKLFNIKLSEYHKKIK